MWQAASGSKSAAGRAVEALREVAAREPEGADPSNAGLQGTAAGSPGHDAAGAKPAEPDDPGGAAGAAEQRGLHEPVFSGRAADVVRPDGELTAAKEVEISWVGLPACPRRASA